VTIAWATIESDDQKWVSDSLPSRSHISIFNQIQNDSKPAQTKPISYLTMFFSSSLSMIFFAVASVSASSSSSLRGGNANAGTTTTFEHRERILEAMSHFQAKAGGDVGTPSPLHRGRLLQGSTACDAEFSAVSSCIAALPSGNSCVGCILSAQDALFADTNTVTCDSYEQGMCTALDGCGCGFCEDEIEAALHCVAGAGSSGACTVDCDPPTSTGGGSGFPGLLPGTGSGTPPSSDICADPIAFLYKGTATDVASCSCTTDELTNTVEVGCQTTDGRVEYFEFVDGNFDAYVEAPSDVSPTVGLVVINHETAGPVCALWPTNVANPTEEHICVECTVCQTGTMVGASFNCHGVSSGGCTPLFPASTLTPASRV